MSTGGITAQLKEDSAKNDSTGLMSYYYTLSDSYSGPKFRGEFNTEYNLEIQVGNAVYTASTTIPAIE